MITVLNGREIEIIISIKNVIRRKALLTLTTIGVRLPMLTIIILRGLSISTLVVRTTTIRLIIAIMFGALEQDSNFFTLKRGLG